MKTNIVGTFFILISLFHVECRRFTEIIADSGPGYVNVRDAPYNAAGDGTTNDAPAFQHALDDVGNQGGGIVFVPTGNYLIDGSLSVPAATVLKGVASHVQRFWGKMNKNQVFGTTLLAVANAGNENGPAFINLAGDSSGVEGLQIFYPNQVEKNPPISYPWAIQCGQPGKSIENTFVKNVLLVNPWKGIDAASNESPRHWFENVYGQPLSMGIAVDQCYDIGRISHIHFWPFWSSNPDLWNWINTNGVTFLFQRTDWEVVEDVFSWGYQTGMSFRSSAHGACNGQFSDINFDNVDIGIDITYTQPYGIFFSNLNLANAGGGNNRIGILGRPNNSTASNTVNLIVRGASFWGEFNQNIFWQNPGLISLSDSLMNSWNKTFPAIDIRFGRAMINNNYFADAVGQALRITYDADRVTVTNNQFVGNTFDIAQKTSFLVASNLP